MKEAEGPLGGEKKETRPDTLKQNRKKIRWSGGKGG